MATAHRRFGLKAILASSSPPELGEYESEVAADTYTSPARMSVHVYDRRVAVAHGLLGTPLASGHFLSEAARTDPSFLADFHAVAMEAAAEVLGDDMEARDELYHLLLTDAALDLNLDDPEFADLGK